MKKLFFKMVNFLNRWDKKIFGVQKNELPKVVYPKMINIMSTSYI